MKELELRVDDSRDRDLGKQNFGETSDPCKHEKLTLNDDDDDDDEIIRRGKSGDLRKVGWLLATVICKASRQDFSSAACWVETLFKVKSASDED